MPISPMNMLLWNLVVTTVLAVLVRLVCCFRPMQRRPAVVHTLWLLVLVKLVTPPVIPVPVLKSAHPSTIELNERTRPADVSIPPTVAVVPHRSDAQPSSIDATAMAFEHHTKPNVAPVPIRQLPWLFLLTGISILGTLILAALGVVRYLRMTRILRLANSSDERVRPLAGIAATRMGLQVAPKLVVADAPIVPFLWVRFRQPAIVLPAKLIEPMSDEQVVCIICHELAHFIRKDHWVNLFASLVVAVFWWFPVAWWARRQLRAAQEVCCDGLVLEREPDTRRCYAETLFQTLEFTQTSHPGSPSPAIGFGDRSSLRRRFEMIASVHVQSRLSRIATAAAVATVIGMLCVPVTAQSPDAKQNPHEAEQQPKEEKQPVTVAGPRAEPAQWLFAKWQASARTDGKIPGALIGQLTRDIDTFVKQYPDNEKSPLLTAFRPRLDASHDWTPQDAVKLLDDLTDISTAPISWRELGLTFAEMQKFTKGQPLPEELKDAAWGDPMENGLRAAWLLQPDAKEYAVGTVLNARVLFHNSGKQPVVFSTDRWHQWDQHKAHDANGVELRVTHGFVTGLTPTATYRLAPDEYCEVAAAKFGIGTEGGHSVPAKVGDEITLSHVVDAATGWAAHVNSDNWKEIWNNSIATRVGREAPLPASVADREQLVRRVKLDMFGVPATAEEITAFVEDKTPEALANLIARLQAKPRLQPWSGRIPTGETKFRVVAAEAKKADAAADVKAKDETAVDKPLRILIDKVLTAHGGQEKLEKLQFTMTVKHSNGEMQKYFVQPPKNFRWETTRRDSTTKRIVILFPEGRRWWSKEPNGDAKEFFLTGIEPAIGYWFDNVNFFGPRVVLRLKDAEHRVTLLSEETEINGHAAEGVEVNGPFFKGKMYFDKQTHVLLKRSADSYTNTQGFSIYSDYKSFDGIPIAQKEQDGYANPEVTQFKAVDRFDSQLFQQP